MKEGAAGILAGRRNDILFSFRPTAYSLSQIVELYRQKMKVLHAAVNAPVPAGHVLPVRQVKARTEIVNPG